VNVLQERMKRGDAPDAEPTEVELLTEIRDALRAPG
jgi:large-conductance mechanosensitive channel